MFAWSKTILVRPSAMALLASVAALAGCGQKGPLFLPSGDQAVGRATLPQTLLPGPIREPAATSASPANSPGLQR
ncbi:LPS translocon maturation chaperone LptM [Ramlibacter rhizophilus]|uniref:Lipoprotein n=1 Tax=Ramlibacter rhizophilus TaxID=1781167 RepID=A0A4Z0BNT5_9BURK|nr:lipoprotein [Ramlibacter rhizophilus]TFY99598.1 hypothetical protein EZ242_10630 [Ramlibacter rhizophilus]